MPTPPRHATQRPRDDAQTGLYADAMIYDILHTPGTAQELDALERIAARHVRPPAPTTHWLEPACGSARCVRLAAKRGTPTTGFDLDPGMVAYANSRIERAGLAGTARALTADMRTCVDDNAIPRHAFGFAFNTINSFRHLTTDRDALDHLAQMAHALRPGGVYAVGISTTAYGLEYPSEDVWRGARGPVAVTQTVQYIPPTGKTGGARAERVLSHLMIERPSGTEHRDSTYALRTYSLEQWLALIARSPFVIEETTDHDGHPCEPAESGYRVFVLRARS